MAPVATAKSPQGDRPRLPSARSKISTLGPVLGLMYGVRVDIFRDIRTCLLPGTGKKMCTVRRLHAHMFKKKVYASTQTEKIQLLTFGG